MESKASAPRPNAASLLERHFLEHPRSLGEGYWEHQGHALRFGVQMIIAGVACTIHSAIPAFFSHTASDTIQRLHSQMSAMGRLRAQRARGNEARQFLAEPGG